MLEQMFGPALHLTNVFMTGSVILAASAHIVWWDGRAGLRGREFFPLGDRKPTCLLREVLYEFLAPDFFAV